jgi:hypothetical protein
MTSVHLLSEWKKYSKTSRAPPQLSSSRCFTWIPGIVYLLLRHYAELTDNWHALAAGGSYVRQLRETLDALARFS